MPVRMMHLLRSLFVGYFIAVTGGAIAVMNGFNPLWVVLAVWFSGSILSVALAATVTPVAGDEDVDLPVNAVQVGSGATEGPMPADLRARELALWDSDLAAEFFEADQARDAVAARNAAEASARDRIHKAG